MRTATVASATTDAIRVATARRWFRLLGHEAVRVPGGTLVITPEHPGTWDANFLLADEDAASSDVLATLDMHVPRGGQQVVQVDALTSGAVEAALALAGFQQQVHTIEMLSRGPIAVARPLPAITLRAVTEADDWRIFEVLVRADHDEGGRTGSIDEAVGEGLLANMRGRSPPATYHLIGFEGAVTGYDLTVACPGGLGPIEELFTLPKWRGRGVMSAFIAAAAERLRAEGCDAIFLDAHAHDTPKHLYARLGFAPIALNRTWVRQKLL
jgi:GNAT superfamily N-acetyltransferase